MTIPYSEFTRMNCVEYCTLLLLCLFWGCNSYSENFTPTKSYKASVTIDVLNTDSGESKLILDYVVTNNNNHNIWLYIGHPDCPNDLDLMTSSRPEWFMGDDQTLIVRRRRWCNKVYGNAWGSEYFTKLAPGNSRHETIEIEIPVTPRTYRSARDFSKGIPTGPETIRNIKIELGYLDIFPKVSSSNVIDPFTKERLIAVKTAQLDLIYPSEPYTETLISGHTIKYCERNDCWSQVENEGTARLGKNKGIIQ